MEAYAQQMCLPEIGPEGQKKLCGSSVLVIGIGGLGCTALPYLAASGIQRIGMIDFDKIETSNLARQTLFGYSDLGRYKAETAKERLSSMYPEVFFQSEISRFDNLNENLLCSYDIIIDATDNLQTRLAINDACRALQKPWVYGSVHQWEGQVSLFLPQNPDYRSLFPHGTSEAPIFNCSLGGVLGPFVGLVGSIQALEAIKWLANIEENLSGKLLLINGKTYRCNMVDLVPPISYEIPYDLLKEWMSKGPVQLIDVRESNALNSLNKNQKIVLYCQTGQRSLVTMRQLRKEGFDAYSLEGGVSNWAIDNLVQLNQH